LPVFGVSQDSANVARSFARRTDATFPILIEPEGYPLSRAFAVEQTPTLYLILPDGAVAFAAEGFAAGTVNALGAAAAAALGEPSTSTPTPLYADADAALVPSRVPG